MLDIPKKPVTVVYIFGTHQSQQPSLQKLTSFERQFVFFCDSIVIQCPDWHPFLPVHLSGWVLLGRGGGLVCVLSKWVIVLLFRCRLHFPFWLLAVKKNRRKSMKLNTGIRNKVNINLLDKKTVWTLMLKVSCIFTTYFFNWIVLNNEIELLMTANKT